MTRAEASEFAIVHARRQGVVAEALCEATREIVVSVLQGRVVHFSDATQRGLGVRAEVRNRVGYGYTDELSPDAIVWALHEAVQNADLQPGTGGFIPPGRPVGFHAVAAAGVDEAVEPKLEKAVLFERTLRENPRVTKVQFADYKERQKEVTIASTEGSVGSYRRALMGFDASFVMQRGVDVKQCWEGRWASVLDPLDAAATARDLVRRTDALLGSRPLPAGEYGACFGGRAFADLLSVAWPLWSGQAVLEGKTPLVGRVGDVIATSHFTLIDDPTLSAGCATRPFDAEGTLGRRTVVVDNGVLRTYLSNSAVSRALQMTNGGHAVRSISEPLDVAPSNFYVDPRAVFVPDTGVLITETIGVRAGTNPATGDFAVQGHGFWLSGGEPEYPVGPFVVAGNFLRLLTEVVATGGPLEWRVSHRSAFGAPVVSVSQLSFAG